jgi:hypothetical protein
MEYSSAARKHVGGLLGVFMPGRFTRGGKEEIFYVLYSSRRQTGFFCLFYYKRLTIRFWPGSRCFRGPISVKSE